MISVVVVARNEGTWLPRTVRQYASTLPRQSEIVVVDDGSTDGSLDALAPDPRLRVIRGKGAGVAQARNLGARCARGDLLVFSDAHLALPEGWWKPLANRAARRGVGGVAPAIASITRPQRIGHGLYFSGADLDVRWLWREDRRTRRAPLIPWCCGMMSRTVFEGSGGFDEGMTGMGSIDNEMSLRLWLLGYELWVVPTVVVGHLFRRRQPYPLTSSMQLHNRARLALVHLELPRLARFLRLNRNDPDFGEALAAAATADIARRRRAVCAQRTRDSEWYFRRFNAR
jgi:glycosyltransferase involved in cell wall biosynthesis